MKNLNSNSSLKHNTNSVNYRPMAGRLQAHRSLDIFQQKILKNRRLSQIQN